MLRSNIIDTVLTLSCSVLAINNPVESLHWLSAALSSSVMSSEQTIAEVVAKVKESHPISDWVILEIGDKTISWGESVQFVALIVGIISLSMTIYKRFKK